MFVRSSRRAARTLRSVAHAGWRNAWLVSCIASGLAACAAAPDHTAGAPTHVHYDAPEQFRTAHPDGSLAPRLQNLGSHSFPVVRASAVGQRFINQGLNLAYGFNHLEASRAFAEAERRDPNNPMALWGHALVLGPNINMPMDPAAEPNARELIGRALDIARKDQALPQRERDYVEALAQRYTGKPEDRDGSDLAYANAMRTLAARYPDDLDAQVLFAEALMDLRPWNYWQGDGTPYSETVEIAATLRKVIAANPNHPGALHFWIHLWEATPTPEEAEDEAERLVDLAPAAGHLVHMPGHIFARIGRHQDSIAANQKAVLADEDYITQCRAQGFYPLGYYPHNIHFIWLSASFAAQSELAIAMAEKTAKAIPDAALAQLPMLQSFKVTPLYALVQFERWDALLAQTRPAVELAFYRGMWHYARGLAQLGKHNDTNAAERELAALRSELNSDEIANTPATASRNSGTLLLRIAERVVLGEIAAARGDYETAVGHLERATGWEDALIYNEPPDWPQPVRQRLGRVLLAAGYAREAEAVYWEDLRRHRDNGWALRGLAAAQRAQGKVEDALLTEARLAKAWANADIPLRLADAR